MAEAVPTLISLFAGAGGLDLGLEAAGFRTVLANEMESHACQSLQSNKLIPTLSDAEFNVWFDKQLEQRCYKGITETAANDLKRRLSQNRRENLWLRHAKVVQGDIRDLSSEDVTTLTGVRRGDVSLIAGGPPCQPFSRSGKRETVAVADGRLFLEFVRMVADLRPRVFLFENVKGLALSRTDVVRWTCDTCMRTAVPPFDTRDKYLKGDEVSIECECGSSQGKFLIETFPDGSLQLILAEFERVGYRCQWKVLNAADFGAPQQRERLFIVGSRDGEVFAWPKPTHSAKAPPAEQGLLDLSGDTTPRRSWRTMYEALWSEGHPVYGKIDLNLARLWVKNLVRPHAEPVTWTLDRPSPTIGAHQAAKLAIAPYGVPEEQLRRQQWHTKGKRQGDFPPVNVVHEYLSDEELLRLQTFPPQWFLYGTRMERARQIGNAVPIVLANAMGRQLAGFADVPQTDNSLLVGVS